MSARIIDGNLAIAGTYNDISTTLHVMVDESVEARASFLVHQGLKTFDALHIACTEAGQANAFVTTDDRLIRWAVQQVDVLQVKVVNPVMWLLEAISNGRE